MKHVSDIISARLQRFAKYLVLCTLTVLPAAAQATFNFSTPVQTVNTNTDTPGKWYIDRFPPNGFVSPVTAPNGTPNTLEESISGADLQAPCDGAPPPLANTNACFYNTQGRDFDLPAGTTSVTIALYVPLAWSMENARTAGFWTCAIGPGLPCNGNTDYPVIEFQGPITTPPASGPGYYPNGGVAGFYGYNNLTGLYDFIGLPAGFTYNSFVQLTISVVGGNYIYTVSNLGGGGAMSIPSPFGGPGYTGLYSALLEGYNYGSDYSIFWDGVASAALMTAAQDNAFQIGYAANLQIGDSVLNLSNNGLNGGFVDPPGTAGNLCVNVYAFDPQEEEIACCACLVTPDGLNSLSAIHDLTSNTLTSAAVTSIVIKLVSSVPGTNSTGTPTICNAATAGTAGTAGGLLAWGSTLEPAGTPGTYAPINVPYINGNLSASELSSLTSVCGFLQSDGSGFGICNSCRAGALGGAKK